MCDLPYILQCDLPHMALETSGARPFEGIICWALADSALSLFIYIHIVP